MCSPLISSLRTDLSNEPRVHSIYDLICVLKRETHLKRRICLSFFKCINLVSINLDKLLASFNKYKYWEMLLKVLVVIYFYSYLAISQRNSSTQIVIVNFKDIGNRFIFFLISFWYCIYIVIDIVDILWDCEGLNQPCISDKWCSSCCSWSIGLTFPELIDEMPGIFIVDFCCLFTEI